MNQFMSLLVIFALSWAALKLAGIGRRGSRLPPGPPTIPILGNIHLLPLKFAFLRFTEWAKIYGGIYSLKVANGTVIVLSDMGLVRELLDNRSSETCSRPPLHAANAVTGGNYMVMADFDTHIWRKGRSSIQPLLVPQAVSRHLPLAIAETNQLLYDILYNPEDFYYHLSRFTLSFITAVVFGKRVPTCDSQEATQFHDYIRLFSKTLAPGAPPVDLLPFLKYVPERWAPWRRLWKETRTLQRSLYFGLLRQAEQRISDGLRNDSYIEDILDRQIELDLSREMIAYIGGVLLDGGAETSSSFLQSLVLCLMSSPASLRKAQEEIDSVMGNERSPTSGDIQTLPYIQALIKETHRYRPVGPTGVPHAMSTDCQYQEYTFPKGTPIFINLWGIFHDPNIFDRPDEFWPDRYLLTPDGTKPNLGHKNLRSSLPFGSGKRLCPGMHLANTNLTLAVMNLIWAFDFAPASPFDPSTHNIDTMYNDGLTLTPRPFACKITPRSEAKVKMIEQQYFDSATILKRYESDDAL